MCNIGFSDGFFIGLNSTTQYSMLLDGVNEYCVVPNKVNYNFTNTQPFTISTWVKTSNFNRTQSIYGKRIPSGTFAGYSLLNDASGVLRIILRNNASNAIIVEFAAPIVNDWHHILFTYDGSSNANGVNVYIDNVSQPLTVIENTLTGTLSNSGDFEIGRAGTSPFLGNIGITRVWDVELTNSEIAADYNSGVMSNSIVNEVACVINFTSGTNALYTGTNWYFPDSTLINEQATYRSTNMEFADRVTDIPV